MRLSRIDKTYRHFHRYQQILSVLIKYGFEDVIARLRAQRYIIALRKLTRRKIDKHIEGLSTAQRIRLAFQELGPAFVKLGQIMSVRPDLVGVELSEELQLLQDQVKPFDFHEVKQIIETGLEGNINNFFDGIEEIPIAAASISQVHKAFLKDGSVVAIKVQRPHIQEVIATDLEILKDIVTVARKYIYELQSFDLPGIVLEIQNAMRKELDFIYEAQSIARFKKLYGKDVYVPEVYWSYTTEKILTMEFVEGTKANQINDLQANGIDPAEIAQKCIESMFTQIYEKGYFHADPHPGNIFVSKDSKVIFLDYGIMGRLDENQRRNLARIFNAVIDRDIEGLINVYRRLNIITDETNIPQFKRTISEFLDRYYNLPAHQIRVKKIATEIFKHIQASHLRMPADYILMMKSIVALESLVLTLDPHFQIEKLSRSFIRTAVRYHVSPRQQYKLLKKYILEMLEMMEHLPDNLHHLADQIMKGKFVLAIEHLKLQNLITEIDRASNRISFGLIVAALIVGSSLLVQSNIGPKIYSFPVFGIIGYFIAGILGLWLIFNILRSKNL